MTIYTFDTIPERLTKEWRHEIISNNSRDNRSEKWQKRTILDNLGVDLNTFENDEKSVRINKRTLEFKNQRKITDREDFMDWTEDFDGIKKVNNKMTYWNLKIIPDSGGAQNRSIRPVIAMVEAFAKHILKNKTTDKYFLCITDGDYYCNFSQLREGNKKTQFEYAIDKVDSKLRKYFYCGPMKDLGVWWDETIK